ncbi:hypothetical protein EJ03DRAFT_101807 [Teratosphaeria nubilosa]|uniref:Uncharacterized protein n=1 Tax=Teratosphaeria nubilosa TaxID=161662 RepID=A0A6G1LL31_9PEZI|nr:hypothetical protein EJ03DRAFT_101807 [Teratosphaeria nubilosa]
MAFITSFCLDYGSHCGVLYCHRLNFFCTFAGDQYRSLGCLTSRVRARTSSLARKERRRRRGSISVGRNSIWLLGSLTPPAGFGHRYPGGSIPRMSTWVQTDIECVLAAELTYGVSGREDLKSMKPKREPRSIPVSIAGLCACGVRLGSAAAQNAIGFSHGLAWSWTPRGFPRRTFLHFRPCQL